MSYCNLYLIRLSGAEEYPMSPYLNEDSYAAISYCNMNKCKDCKMAEVTESMSCVHAADAREVLLKDKLLTQDVSYIILDQRLFPGLGKDSPRESTLNSIAKRLMEVLDGPVLTSVSYTLRMHDFLSRALDTFCSCGLAYTREEALATLEFQALRQRVQSLQGAKVHEYDLPFSVHPRTLLERIVLTPIANLPNELAAVRASECPVRS
jgi:hypothetical protein